MHDRGRDRRRAQPNRGALPAEGPPGAESPRFARVPWALQDSGVDAASIAVFAALQRFRDRRAKLRALGWLDWTSGKADGRVNAYTVHLSREGRQEAPTPGRQQPPTPSAPPAEEVGTTRRGGRRQLPTTESQYREPVPRATDREQLPGEAGASGAAQRPPANDNGKGGHPRGGDGPTFGTLMGLVRRHLYVPDGQPPADYDAARDGQILKQLLRRGRSVDDLAVAIEGVALLRDQPGLYGEDVVEWLGPPGTKLTLRALLKRSGVQTVWVLATRAFWTRENRRPVATPRTGAPVPIAALVRPPGAA